MKFKNEKQRRAVMASLNQTALKGVRRAKKIRTVIDTETTGFANRDKLIEVAVLSKDESGREHAYRALVNPPAHISKYATAVHGYVNDDLRGMPKFSQIRPELQEIIDKSDEVIAHNANFDVRMLRNEGIRIPDEKIVDTMRLAKDYKPLEKALPEGRYNLDEMCRGLGVKIPPEDRHSAFGDAKATMRCYEIMQS